MTGAIPTAARYRLSGYSARPVHRLGQASDTLVREAARTLINQAEPRVRDLISGERTRLADAAKTGLPFAGIAGAIFLLTHYFVKPTAKAVRVVGYSASAATAGLGGYLFFDRLADVAPPPPPPSGGTGSGIVQSLVNPVAHQIAQAVVSEAEPKVRAIVEDEKLQLAEGAKAALPWGGAAAAAAAATAFAVPQDLGWAKAAGYSLAALLAVVGAWRGLDVYGTPRPKPTALPGAPPATEAA